MYRAFTLIETVIIVGLTAILMSAAAYLYVNFSTTYRFLDISLGVTGGAASIIEEAREAGMQASHFVASHDFSGTTYTSGTTTAIFELPSINASGVVVSGSFDYIGIHASGTEAFRFVDADAASSRDSGTKRLTDVLAALSFTYDDPSIVSATSVVVDATTTDTAYGETTESHVRSHIYLRNI